MGLMEHIGVRVLTRYMFEYVQIGQIDITLPQTLYAVITGVKVEPIARVNAPLGGHR